jgi:CBS domain-containing protein
MNVEESRPEVVIDPSRPVQVVYDSTTVAEALRLMHRAHVRHLPVITRGRCTGVLVDVDLVAAALDGVTDPVAWLARRPVPTVALGADARTAARALVAGGMDAALVLDDGAVVGIVTATDVMEGLAGSSCAVAVRGVAAGPSALPSARPDEWTEIHDRT